MRAALALALVLVPLAGCVGEDTPATPALVPVTFHVVLSGRPTFGAERADPGSPAPHAFVQVMEAWQDVAADVRARQAAPWPSDPGCEAAGHPFHPDCSAWRERPAYRASNRASAPAYPVREATSDVVLLLPAPTEVMVQLYGPATEDHPAIAPREGCASQYLAVEVRAIEGAARDLTTAASTPWVHVDGPATIEVGWGAFPYPDPSC